jgi:hypothetical protein
MPTLAGAAASDPDDPLHLVAIASRFSRQDPDRSMTSAQTLDRYRAALAEIGEDIEIRRYGGTGAARTPLKHAAVRGRVLAMGADELIGDTIQRTRKVILLNDPAAVAAPGCVALSDLLPVTTNDKLFFRDGEVAILDVDDDTRRINGVLIALEIVVRG